ncbi:MAG: sugar phosphate isomerase/epimerase, partial [Clostridia bacterium]|nr:sugar phosphate isomerase/epimerase [Clostridia bacterium]
LIGSPYVVYHPLMPYGARNDPDPEGTWAINEEFVRKLLPYAKEKGVILCIENMGLKHLSVSSVEQMVAFVRRVNDDHLKFCLDTGHARNMELEPADAVRMAGKELHTLHVHDNNGKNDNHWVPMTGVIDFKALAEALEEVGYEGDFNLEISGRFSNLSTYLSDHAKLQITKILLDEFL